jgi:hypothetical protein
MLVERAVGREVEAAIGAFASELWMTSYESSFFVDAARLAAVTERASAARRRRSVA